MTVCITSNASFDLKSLLLYFVCNEIKHGLVCLQGAPKLIHCKRCKVVAFPDGGHYMTKLSGEASHYLCHHHLIIKHLSKSFD